MPSTTSWSSSQPSGAPDRWPARDPGFVRRDIARRLEVFGDIVSAVERLIDGDAAGNQAQAEYFRRELSGIRAQAETDLARRYIELQQVQNSGLIGRAADVRRVIRALELEVTTLERLGEGLNRWL